MENITCKKCNYDFEKIDIVGFKCKKCENYWCEECNFNVGQNNMCIICRLKELIEFLEEENETLYVINILKQIIKSIR